MGLHDRRPRKLLTVSTVEIGKAETFIINYKGSCCILFKEKDANSFYLWGLYTEPEYRNKGSASEVLKQAKTIALNHNMSLVLDALPFRIDQTSLSLNELISFYKKNGFTIAKQSNKKDSSVRMKWSLVDNT